MRRKVVVKRAEFVPGAPKDWTLIYPETDTETKTLIMGIVEVEPGQHTPLHRQFALIQIETDEGITGIDVSPTPLREEVPLEPLKIEGGYAEVPQGPGLGVELNEGVISRFTFEL